MGLDYFFAFGGLLGQQPAQQKQSACVNHQASVGPHGQVGFEPTTNGLWGHWI